MKYLVTTLIILVAGVQQVFSQAEQGTFRFSADAGFGYRLGKVPEVLSDDVEAFIQDQRSGAMFKGSVSYQLAFNWGVGVQFSRFLSQDSAFLIDENGLPAANAENVRITYVAPYAFYNYTTYNGLHTLASTLSLGYLRYSNDGNFNNNFFERTANSIGVGMGINYDFHINEYLAVGAGLDLILGSFGEFEETREIGGTEVIIKRKVGDFGGDERENLSSVALTIGVKVYL